MKIPSLFHFSDPKLFGVASKNLRVSRAVLSLLCIVWVTLACQVLQPGKSAEVTVPTQSPATAAPLQAPEQNAPAPTDTLSPTLTPTPEPTQPPTEPPPPTQPPGPEYPIFSSLHLPGGGTSEIMLVGRNGIERKTVPVVLASFFDYQPASRRVAYTSQNSHAAAGSHTAVTDLWVYDLNSDQNQRWLADNVVQARWSPAGIQPERLAVVLFDTDRQQLDLAIVGGPEQVDILAGCMSPFFSWSPDGGAIVYVAHDVTSGVPEACYGTYRVSLQDRSVQKVSDFGIQPLGSASSSDRPLWALEKNTIFFPGQPFWIAPLDNSPAFTPEPSVGGEVALWSSDLNQFVTQAADMYTPPSIWVHQFSSDLRTIVDSYQAPAEAQDVSYTLVDWWAPGYRVLVLRHTNADDLFGTPRIWDLIQRAWLDIGQ